VYVREGKTLIKGLEKLYTNEQRVATRWSKIEYQRVTGYTTRQVGQPRTSGFQGAKQAAWKACMQRRALTALEEEEEEAKGSKQMEQDDDCEARSTRGALRGVLREVLDKATESGISSGDSALRVVVLRMADMRALGGAGGLTGVAGGLVGRPLGKGGDEGPFLVTLPLALPFALGFTECLFELGLAVLFRTGHLRSCPCTWTLLVAVVYWPMQSRFTGGLCKVSLA